VTKNKDLNAAIDNLLKNYKTPEEIIGENGLLQQLTKAVVSPH
jgi:putative transposase